MSNRFEERLGRLRNKFGDLGIEALYICGEPNVAYFTGRKGNDCFLYVTADEAFIITDFRYREMAQSLTWLEYFEIFSGKTIFDLINSRREKVIGVEKDKMPLNVYLDLKEKCGSKEFRPVKDIVLELREVKDEFEIEATRKACSIAMLAFDHMCGFLRPGLTERQAAAELEYFMKKNGAEDLSFDTILITGAKTSLPHGVPGDDVIQKGDFVTMDYGCKVDGYCSDETRTVAIGSATQEMKDVYSVVLEAQLNACRNIKAGITGKEADSLARDVIEKAGYGEYFGHSLGHGTGLEIHESPRYAQTWTQPIKAGTIVSIEPGIYLPKKFGVRIEDLALVTEKGIINFVTAPKELIIL
ncbi:MAG: aminopeptidase P family protein [Firmicutes bacterium]|nr:aminopeptidase P family protein [Bacillota bacterium]